MPQRVVSSDLDYQGLTPGTVIDGQKCIRIFDQQRVVSNHDGFQSLEPGAVVDGRTCVALWPGQRVVSFEDGYKTCKPGAVIDGVSCLIIERFDKVVSFEDAYQSCAVGRKIDQMYCILLREGERVVSHDTGYQSCSKGSYVDNTNCVILRPRQRVVSWQDGYQSLAPGSIVDGSHCIILNEGARVVSWQDGFSSLVVGNVVDGVHCVILQEGDRVVSWDDGFKTCKPGSVVDDVHCLILREGYRVASANSGWLDCEPFTAMDLKNAWLLDPGARIVSAHDGYQTCRPGTPLGSQCFNLYAGQRVVSWEDGYRSCSPGATPDNSNCVILRRHEQVVSASMGYQSYAPGDRVNNTSCVALDVAPYDRSRFETAAKMLLEIVPGQTLNTMVPMPDGDLSEMTVVLVFSATVSGLLFYCNRPDIRSTLTLVLRADGDVTAIQELGDQKQTCSSVSLRASGTDLFDGTRHSIAFRCDRESRDILIDGKIVTANVSGTINAWPEPGNGDDVFVAAQWGGADPVSRHPLAGSLYCAGIWQYAMSRSEIQRASFGFLNGLHVGLAGYWPFEGSLEDLSPSGNTLRCWYPLRFQPTVQSYWSSASLPVENDPNSSPLNDYLLFHIDGIAHLSEDPRRTIETSHSFEVGSSALLFGALKGRRQQLVVDDTVRVTLTGPDGTSYDSNVASDTMLVRATSGGVRAFVIKAPRKGRWKVKISAAANKDWTFQVQALPSGDSARVATARDLALQTLQSGFDDSSLDRKRSDAEGGGWRWWAERVAAAAVVGVIAVLTLPADVAVAPLVIAVLVASARGAEAAAAAKHVRGMNRSDPITANAQTSDWMTVNDHRKGVLIIDGANRSPNGAPSQNADRVYPVRKNLLEPLLTSDAGLATYKTNYLAANQVNRTAVLNALNDPELVYVSASGHGQVEELLGWLLPNSSDRLEAVIDTSIADTLVRGKIFHFLACNIGAPTFPNAPNRLGLAAKLARELGAKASFGYVLTYDIGTGGNLLLNTCTADSEIDRVLLSGGTAGQAFQAAKDKYQQLINDSKPGTKERLAINASMLVMYGDPNAKL